MRTLFVVDPTHVIVLMVPVGATLDVSRVAEVAVSAGAEIVATRAVPVPVTLADRRAVTNLLVHSADPDELSARLRDLSDRHGVDIALQPQAARCQSYGLAVFDMDSTLIQCEVIDQLADQAGVGAEVSAITEQAMRGELDFSQSFAERLGLLKGLDSGVVQQLANELPLTDGGKELILTLKTRGIKTVILSGGFDVFAERVASELGMDDYYANKLHTRAGALTGEVITPIVNAEFKEAKLRELASGMGIDMRQTMAVGDGANDLNMLNAAGIGIAFRAKPAVRLRARYRLQMVGLDGALHLIGNQND
jgi:phosphoserine phosphatase